MRALFVPLLACLLLSGCALPLMQAASTQMMPNTLMTPATPACAAGTACPSGMGSELAKGVGASIQHLTSQNLTGQNLTGLASADQPSGK
jgi:hypothetical protein